MVTITNEVVVPVYTISLADLMITNTDRIFRDLLQTRMIWKKLVIVKFR